MDPATLALLEVGFSVAGKLFDFMDAPQAAEPRVRELEAFVSASVQQLDQSIRGGVFTIIEKIERDNLELLISRARNLSNLLDMERTDQALQYAMTVRESVDYARNRLDEGKEHWLGPYLAGNSIYLAALEAAGERHEREVASFGEFLTRTKVQVLDLVAPRILQSGGGLPWLDIAAFLNGGTEALPALLRHLPDEGVQQFVSPLLDEPLLPDVDPEIHALAVELFQGQDRACVAPDIPMERFEAAQRKLLTLADPGDPLVALVDTTAFRGAKDGIAIFSSYCIIGMLWSSPERREYALLPPDIVARGSSLRIGGVPHELLEEGLADAVCTFLLKARALYTTG
jgi:hypothetical protein